MPGNNVTLDIRRLGQRAGVAKGFEDTALTFQKTMELRRSQRIERMMHVEKLTLGVERMMAEDRRNKLNARLQLTNMQGIDRRDIRGHKARKDMQQVQMGHESGLQERAEAAQFRLLGDRLSFEENQATQGREFQAEQAALGRSFQGEQGDKDRFNRLQIARIRSGPALQRLRADLEREQDQTNSAMVNSIRVWSRQNVFDDGKGNFDRDRWRRLHVDGGAAGLSLDQIANQWRTEWINDMQGSPEFSRMDLEKSVSQGAFRTYLKSVVTGDADQEAAAVRDMSQRVRMNNNIRWDDAASRLEYDAATGTSTLDLKYNPQTEKLDFIGDAGNSKLYNQFINSVGNGDLPTRREKVSAFTTLMASVNGAEGLSNQQLQQAAAEMDWAIFQNTGEHARLSLMHPAVFFGASNRVKGSVGTPEDDDPFQGDVGTLRTEVLNLSGAFNQLAATTEKYNHSRRNEDPAGLYDALADVEAQLADLQEQEGQDAVEIQLLRLRKSISNDLIWRVVPPDEEVQEEAPELKSPRISPLNSDRNPFDAP